MSDERPVSLSSQGPPSTVLDPEPEDARLALENALGAPAAERRDAIAGGVRPLAAVPRRLGPAGRRAGERRGGLRVLPRRLPPRPRPAAGQRLAGERLRALAATRPIAASCGRCGGSAQAAARIGEADEAERCAQFLAQLDPSGVPESG